MIIEDYDSEFLAWCEWADRGVFSNETSIAVFRTNSHIFINEVVWYIQPNNGKKMCDVESEFGGFGVAMKLALKMFQGEFKND